MKIGTRVSWREHNLTIFIAIKGWASKWDERSWHHFFILNTSSSETFCPFWPSRLLFLHKFRGERKVRRPTTTFKTIFQLFVSSAVKVWNPNYEASIKTSFLSNSMTLGWVSSPSFNQHRNSTIVVVQRQRCIVRDFNFVDSNHFHVLPILVQNYLVRPKVKQDKVRKLLALAASLLYLLDDPRAFFTHWPEYHS